MRGKAGIRVEARRDTRAHTFLSSPTLPLVFVVFSGGRFKGILSEASFVAYSRLFRDFAPNVPFNVDWSLADK